MPLQDHFHPPLFPQRSWESFHSRWANSIADALQQVLPRRYFAEVQIHLGTSVEADVAEFERCSEPEEGPRNGPAGAVALKTWMPPAATMVLPAVFPDDLEVQVRDERDDARLVAVVELVSPRNKDRAESRRAFAAKCAAYLQRGIGMVIVDIVTSRHGNMHNELMTLLQLEDSNQMPAETALYAVAYRPARREQSNQFAVWTLPLALGEALPLLPLAVRGYRAVPLDLDAAHTDACQRSRF
jgi:hypothetical protein